MSPMGVNWLLFIGVLMLATLGLGVLGFVLINVFVHFVRYGMWSFVIAEVGMILAFSGFIIALWKDEI